MDILSSGLCNRNLVQLLRIEAGVQEPYTRATVVSGPARSLVRFQGHSNASPRSGTPWSISFPSAQPLRKQIAQSLCTPERGRMWACAHKSPELGAGGRTGGQEHLLLLQNIQVRFSAPTSGGSQPFVISAPGHLSLGPPWASTRTYSYLQHTVLYLSRVGFHAGL